MTGPDGRPGGGFALGVDLGTSHTVVVLRRPDGRTRPLLFDGQPLMPSAVFLDRVGRLHVGRDAQRLGQAEPDRFEPNPKRRIDEDTVLLGDESVPVVGLLAALLAGVAREAVTAVGFLPPAVLTHPASWGPRRRDVLTEAIARAGWPPVGDGGTVLLPEPVAAARYFSDVLRRPVPVGSALAVFDFGGGTLDIAVVRNEGLARDGRARFTVAGSGGVDDLGGLDLDAALVEHVGTAVAASEPAAWATLQEPVTAAQWRARRQFWDDVRGAKEMLSRTSTAPIAVPGVEHAVHLTRDELEQVTAPLLRRGVAEAASVIAACGLDPTQLAGLFLVGGSSRVPLVARLLHNDLGIAPTVLEQPELPVAEGALVEAASSLPRDTSAQLANPTIGAGSGMLSAQGVGVSSARGEPAATVPTAGTAAMQGTAPMTGTAPTTGTAPMPVSPAPSPMPISRSPARKPAPVPNSVQGAPGDDLEYAPAVDPWAGGEAEALASSGGPAYATGAGPTHTAPAYQVADFAATSVTAPEDTAPEVAAGGGRLRSAYRRPLFWIVAAAVTIVVAVSATAFVLWPRGYPALDYRTLSDVKIISAPVASTFAITQVVGDRTYLAGSATDGPLVVLAVETATGKEIWRSEAAGTAASWEGMVGLPGKDMVAVFTATDSTTSSRRMVVLGGANGGKLWERNLGRQDTLLFVGDTVVVAEYAEARIVGLDLGEKGKVRWEKDNPKSTSGGTTTEIVPVTSVDDVSGPAGVTGAAFARDLDDVPQFVRIGADRSVEVFDADSGKSVSKRDNLADPNDTSAPVVAHNGRLIVASNANGYQIFAYDLTDLASQKAVLNAPDAERAISVLTPCGADRVCFVDTAGYDTKSTAVVAVDVAEGAELWRTPVPEAVSLVAVGESVIVGRNTSPEEIARLLDGKGAQVWERPGNAGRIDGGNILSFAKAVRTYPEDVSLSGEHLGDDPTQLGPLTGARTSSCSWGEGVIACAADESFVLRRYAD